MAYLQLEFRHPQLGCWLPAGHPLLPAGLRDNGRNTTATPGDTSAYCSRSSSSGTFPAQSERNGGNLPCGIKPIGEACCGSGASFARHSSNTSCCCCTLLPLPDAASVIDLDAFQSGTILVFGRKSFSDSSLSSTQTPSQQHEAAATAAGPPQATPAAAAAPEAAPAAQAPQASAAAVAPRASLAAASKAPALAASDAATAASLAAAPAASAAASAAQGVAEVATAATGSAGIFVRKKERTGTSEDRRADPMGYASVWWSGTAREGGRAVQQQSCRGQKATAETAPFSTVARSDPLSLCLSTGVSCEEAGVFYFAGDSPPPAGSRCSAPCTDDFRSCLNLSDRRVSSISGDTLCSRISIGSIDDDSGTINNSGRPINSSRRSVDKSSRCSSNSRRINCESLSRNGRPSDRCRSGAGSAKGSDDSSHPVLLRCSGSSGSSAESTVVEMNGIFSKHNYGEQYKEDTEEHSTSGTTAPESHVYFPSTNPFLSRRHFIIMRKQLVRRPRKYQQQQLGCDDRQLQQKIKSPSSIASYNEDDTSSAVYVVAARPKSTDGGERHKGVARGLLLLNTSSASSRTKNLRGVQAALPAAVGAAVSAAVAADYAPLIQGTVVSATEADCCSSSSSGSSTSNSSSCSSTSSDSSSGGSGKCHNAVLCSTAHHADTINGDATCSRSRGERSNCSRSSTRCPPDSIGEDDSSCSYRTPVTSSSCSTGAAAGDIFCTDLAGCLRPVATNSKCSTTGASSTFEAIAGDEEAPSSDMHCRDILPLAANYRISLQKNEGHTCSDAAGAAAGKSAALEKKAAAAATASGWNVKCDTQNEEKSFVTLTHSSALLPSTGGNKQWTTFTHLVYEPHVLHDGDQLYIPILDATLLHQQEQERDSCTTMETRQTSGCSTAADTSGTRPAEGQCTSAAAAASDGCSSLTSRSCRPHSTPRKKYGSRHAGSSRSCNGDGSHSFPDGDSSDSNSSRGGGNSCNRSRMNGDIAARSCGSTLEERDTEATCGRELLTNEASRPSESAAVVSRATGSKTSSSSYSCSSTRSIDGNSSSAAHGDSGGSSSNRDIGGSDLSRTHCHVCGRYSPLHCFRYVFRLRKNPPQVTSNIFTSPSVREAETAFTGAAVASSRRAATAVLLRKAAEPETAGTSTAAAAAVTATAAISIETSPINTDAAPLSIRETPRISIEATPVATQPTPVSVDVTPTAVLEPATTSSCSVSSSGNSSSSVDSSGSSSSSSSCSSSSRSSVNSSLSSNCYSIRHVPAQRGNLTAAAAGTSVAVVKEAQRTNVEAAAATSGVEGPVTEEAPGLPAAAVEASVLLLEQNMTAIGEAAVAADMPRRAAGHDQRNANGTTPSLPQLSNVVLRRHGPAAGEATEILSANTQESYVSVATVVLDQDEDGWQIQNSEAIQRCVSCSAAVSSCEVPVEFAAATSAAAAAAVNAVSAVLDHSPQARVLPACTRYDFVSAAVDRAPRSTSPPASCSGGTTPAHPVSTTAAASVVHANSGAAAAAAVSSFPIPASGNPSFTSLELFCADSRTSAPGCQQQQQIQVPTKRESSPAVTANSHVTAPKGTHAALEDKFSGPRGDETLASSAAPSPPSTSAEAVVFAARHPRRSSAATNPPCVATACGLRQSVAAAAASTPCCSLSTAASVSRTTVSDAAGATAAAAAASAPSCSRCTAASASRTTHSAAAAAASASRSPCRQFTAASTSRATPSDAAAAAAPAAAACASSGSRSTAASASRATLSDGAVVASACASSPGLSTATFASGTALCDAAAVASGSPCSPSAAASLSRSALSAVAAAHMESVTVDRASSLAAAAAKTEKPYVRSRYFALPAGPQLHLRQQLPYRQEASIANGVDRGSRNGSSRGHRSGCGSSRANSSSGTVEGGTTVVPFTEEPECRSGSTGDISRSFHQKSESMSTAATRSGNRCQVDNDKPDNGSRWGPESTTYTGSSTSCSTRSTSVEKGFSANSTGALASTAGHESSTSRGVDSSMARKSPAYSRSLCPTGSLSRSSTCSSTSSSETSSRTTSRETSSRISSSEVRSRMCIGCSGPLEGKEGYRCRTSCLVGPDGLEQLQGGRRGGVASGEGGRLSISETSLHPAAADAGTETAAEPQLQQLEPPQRSSVYHEQCSTAECGQSTHRGIRGSLSPSHTSPGRSPSALLLQCVAGKEAGNSRRLLRHTDSTTTTATTGTIGGTTTANEYTHSDCGSSSTARHTSDGGTAQLHASQQVSSSSNNSSSGLWWRKLPRRRHSSDSGTPARLSDSSSRSSSSSSSCSSHTSRYSCARGGSSESCSMSPLTIIRSPPNHLHLPGGTPSRSAGSDFRAAANPATAAAVAYTAASRTAGRGSATASFTTSALSAAAAAVPRCTAAAAGRHRLPALPDASTPRATPAARAQEESEAIEEIVDALECESSSQLCPSVTTPFRPLPLLSQQRHPRLHLQEEEQVPLEQQQPLGVSRHTQSQQRNPLPSRHHQQQQQQQQQSRRDCPTTFERHAVNSQNFFRRSSMLCTPRRQHRQQHCLQEPRQVPQAQQQCSEGVQQQQQEPFDRHVSRDEESPMVIQEVLVNVNEDEESLAVEDILNAITPLAEEGAPRTMTQQEQAGSANAVRVDNAGELPLQQREQTQLSQAFRQGQADAPANEDDHVADVDVSPVPPEEACARQQRICAAGECCAICKEELVLQREIASLPSCSHLFCFLCIAKWACCVKKQQRPTCPLCKQNFLSISRFVCKSPPLPQETQRRRSEASDAAATSLSSCTQMPGMSSVERGAHGRRSGNRTIDCDSMSRRQSSQTSSCGRRRRSRTSLGNPRELNATFLFAESIESDLHALLRHRRLKGTGGGASAGDSEQQHTDPDAEAAAGFLLSPDSSSASEEAGGAGGCQVCGQDTDWTNMLLCDRCNEGFHLYCLNPPLQCVPPGSWFCPPCTTEARSRRAAARGAATDAAEARAARRRERELRRDRSRRRNRDREAQQQQQQLRRQQEQQQQQRQQRRHEHRQRQNRYSGSGRNDSRRHRRRRRCSNSPTAAAAYDDRTQEERRSPSRDSHSLQPGGGNNSESSSGSSRARRTLDRHGWLDKYLFRRPEELVRHTTGVGRGGGGEALAAALPTGAHDNMQPNKRAAGSMLAASAAAATTAAPPILGSRRAAAAANPLGPAIDDEEVYAVQEVSSGSRNSEDAVESFAGQRRRKRGRIISLSEPESVADTHEAEGGPSARGEQQQQHQQQQQQEEEEEEERQQHRNSLLSRGARRRSSSSSASSIRSREHADRAGSSRLLRSAELGCRSGEALCILSSRRTATGAHGHSSQRAADQRERAEGERQDTRTVMEEQEHVESDGYDLDGFVVSSRDPLVPASETSKSSSCSGSASSRSCSGSSEEEEDEDESQSRSRGVSRRPTRRNGRRRRYTNSRRMRLSRRGESASGSAMGRKPDRNTREDDTTRRRTNEHAHAPLRQQLGWRRPAENSTNRETPLSSTIGRDLGGRMGDHKSTRSPTAAATVSRGPLRTGLPRQGGVRSLAARAAAHLPSHRNTPQQSLWAKFHFQRRPLQ